MKSQLHATQFSHRKVDLFSTYQQLIAQGWQADAAQARAVIRLQNLAQALQSNLPQPPRGLWLYGPPGRGKSQLLNLFMQQLPITTKRRVHFHQFMTELHQRMNALPTTNSQGKKVDPIEQIALEISANATVLGFDEFYLTNLPDAIFLGRLMQALFRLGTVVVATSNWPLPELFQGGLRRESFLPLLRLMESKLEPIDLGFGIDFRQHQTNSTPTKQLQAYYITVPVGESAEAHLNVLFNEFAIGQQQPALPFLRAKQQRGTALWVKFSQVCDQPLGRQEFQQLAKSFQTVVIEDIPRLSASEADAALRLVALVDILYEHGARLIISSVVTPAQICAEGPAAQVFQRTASRLMEMTTPSSAPRHLLPLKS